MNTEKLIELFNSLRNELEEIRKPAEDKLIHMIKDDTPLLIDLSSSIILSDGLEIFIYQNAFIALKNVFTLPENPAVLEKLYKTTISKDNRTKLKEAAIRGLLFEDQTIGSLSGFILKTIFTIEKTEFPILQLINSIIDSEESLCIKQNCFNCLGEIFSSGIFNGIPPKVWEENYANDYLELYSKIINMLNEGVEYDSASGAQVFQTILVRCLIVIMQYLQEFHEGNEKYSTIMTCLINVHKRITDTRLYQALWDFYYQNLTFNYNKALFHYPSIIFSEFITSINQKNPIFSCIALSTISKFFDFEEKISKVKKYLEKYEKTIKEEKALHLWKRCILPISSDCVILRNTFGTKEFQCIKLFCNIISDANVQEYFNKKEKCLEEGGDEYTIKYLPLQVSILLNKLMKVKKNDILQEIKKHINNFPKYEQIAVLLFLYVISDTISLEVETILQNNFSGILFCTNSENSAVVEFAISLITKITRNFNILCFTDNIIGIINILREKMHSRPLTVSLSIDLIYIIIENIDLSNEELFNTVIPSIIDFCSNVLQREDAFKSNLVERTYKITEIIINKTPKANFGIIESIFSSSMEQISQMYESKINVLNIPNEVCISCLLHIISAFFINFPEEMRKNGENTSNFLFKMVKDINSPNYKDSLKLLITIVNSLGNESRELLTKINECISTALWSGSPEIINDTLLMLNILLSSLSVEDISSFGSVIEIIFSVIERGDMINYIPSSLRSISEIMFNMRGIATINHKKMIYNNLMRMIKLPELIEDDNRDFRNMVLKSFFESMRFLILSEKEKLEGKKEETEELFFANKRKFLKEIFISCNIMYKYIPYSNDVLKSFAYFIEAVLLFGNVSAPLLLKETTGALLYACLTFCDKPTKELIRFIFTQIALF